MRALALLVMVLMVSACGFRPLYASLEGSEELGGALGEIELGPVRGPTEARDLMRDELSSRLPPANGDETYLMAVELDELRRAVAVSTDNNVSRFDYRLTGRIVYTNRETGESRVQNVRTVVSFGVVPSQYASLVGREDAVRRAVTDLARKIEIDAALYATGRATDASEAATIRDRGSRDPLRQFEVTTEEDAEPADDPFSPEEDEAPAPESQEAP